MKPVVSIVMAYHNRRSQVINTLKTISNSLHRFALEVIIVDDGSDEENRLESIVGMRGLKIKIIRVEPEEKTWHNSCIPYNMGFKHAESDLIIIQNAECLHVGDVVNHVVQNCTDNNYIAFACYSADKEKSRQIAATDLADTISYIYDIKTIINPTVDKVPSNDCENGWYCHSLYNPSAHHFCSAITRKNLDALDGFDERYAAGLAYEDMEFIRRIRATPIRIEFCDHPFVVHQAHKPTDYAGKHDLFMRNQKLYSTGICQ